MIVAQQQLIVPNKGGQEDFLNDWSHFFCAIQGGQRSGKTHAGVFKLITLLIYNNVKAGPGINALIVSQDWKALWNVIVPKVVELAPLFGLGTKVKKKDCQIELPDLGCLIHLYSAENPAGIAGIEVAVVLCDEAARYKPSDLPKLDPILNATARCSDKRAPLRQCLFVSTPEAGINTFRKMFKLHKGDDRAIYRADAYDNPHVDISQQEALYSGTIARAYMHGYDLDLGGQTVYDCFSDLNIDEKLTLDKNLPLHISCDFGGSNHYLLGQHRPDGMIYVVEEFHRPKLRTRSFVDELDNWFKKNGKWDQVHLYGDFNGSTQNPESGVSHYELIRDGIQKMGMTCRVRIPSKNPPVGDRINCANVTLKALDDKIGYKIHPRCKGLIEDFRHTIFNDKGNGILKSEEYSHFTDAEGYRISYLKKFDTVRSKPKYQFNI